nr:PREDICTED: uncharacterized protein LOC107077179 [Lepisosteus oculatus]
MAVIWTLWERNTRGLMKKKGPPKRQTRQQEIPGRQGRWEMRPPSSPNVQTLGFPSEHFHSWVRTTHQGRDDRESISRIQACSSEMSNWRGSPDVSPPWNSRTSMTASSTISFTAPPPDLFFAILTYFSPFLSVSGQAYNPPNLQPLLIFIVTSLPLPQSAFFTVPLLRSLIPTLPPGSELMKLVCTGAGLHILNHLLPLCLLHST